MEVQAPPVGPREGPFLLGPLDERLVRMPYLQQDPRLLIPVARAVLEEVVEEPQLQPTSVVGVEGSPVLPAVDLEPLVVAARVHEPLEVAPAVQALPAPVGGREDGDADPGEVDRSGRVV